MTKFPAATRTLNYYRDLGCLAGRVDRTNPRTRHTVDLFGIFDLVVVGSPAYPTLYVQATTGDHHAARRAKVLASPACLACLEAGNGVAIVSWRKGGPAGKRKVWTPKVQLLTSDDWRAAQEGGGDE
jgi:hypothetical protein